MPKKKKAKDSSSTEFKFDYRYTPKPYFTAPSPAASPLSSQSSLNKSVSSSGASKLTPQRSGPSSGFNSDTWQNQRQMNYGYNRSVSYARAATQASASSPVVTRATPKQSSIEVIVDEDVSNAASASQNDQATTRKMFEEMFRGRVEANVIEMVLQSVNWNENEALDLLSQLAPEENTHLHPTLSSFAASDTNAAGAVYGAFTPDHNLTPTAPTLSYNSSITSLDEYGLEYCKDMTQRNLSQVADVLRNGPDDINDLDRQKLARSRATTPRSVLKNNTMTLKNISLGSTESLESNRSLYNGLDPSGITYPATSLTPKKSNFEKTMSLHDISSTDDGGLTLTVTRDQGGADLDSARSDPGGVEAFLIPLDGHGDIVLEKGMYEQLNDESSKTESTASGAQGPLPRSVSISDYRQAISSLTSQLHTEGMTRSSSTNDSSAGPASTSSSTRPSGGESSHSSSSGSEAVISPVHGDHSPSVSKGDKPTLTSPETYASSAVPKGDPSSVKISSARNKENQYPYNGILSSGTAVPTAFESARPKKPKPTTQNDEVVAALLETARSGEKVMFIMRGVPGSGKSTLGRQLLDGTEGDIFSGDDFFINSRGEYRHEMEKLPEAHSWNQDRVRKAAMAGVSPIVVDNTHTQSWEMEPYIVMCIKHGYRPILAEPNTVWRYKSKELAKKNIHGVPSDKIKVMLERFEHSVTVKQLIDRVSKRDKTLLPMAEQLLANLSGTKLSRRKPASKTIKRNKQHTTVEKFKDKKVDELTQQLAQLQRSVVSTPQAQENSGDDDNHGETEIMYPSVTSLSGLKRKPTVKVLNCERTVIVRSTDGDKPSEVKGKAPSEVKDKAPADSHQTLTPASIVPVKITSRDPSENDAPVVPAPKPFQSEICDELKIKPISASDVSAAARDVSAPARDVSASATLDKSISVDSGLTLTAVKNGNRSRTLSIPDQSELTKELDSNQPDSGIDSGDKALPVGGSSTLPRPNSRCKGTEGEESQSASLPRPPKDKSKARRSAHKKSNSTNLLQVDADVKDRWLSNDWAIPPYPVVSSAADTVDPPPPYEEHDSSASATTATTTATTVKPPLEDLFFSVKKKDADTLTEPIDYAMAYKAMQYNHHLPEGWILLSGHSIEAFPSSESGIPHKSSVVTYDKSTVITESDRPVSDHESGDGRSPDYTGSQLQRIHSCFPQLSREQVAEVLELCQGDETWATNILLDSNKLHLPKPKHQLTRVLSLPESKRLRAKYNVGKVSLLKKLNKAIVPVASCLGRQTAPTPHSQLKQDTVTLNLSLEQAHSLHSTFGPGVDMPHVDGDIVNVDVPRWIANRIYRSMMSSITPDVREDRSLSESDRQAPGVRLAPQRPARRKKATGVTVSGDGGSTTTSNDSTSTTTTSTKDAAVASTSPLGGLSDMIKADVISELVCAVADDASSVEEDRQDGDSLSGHGIASGTPADWSGTPASAAYGSPGNCVDAQSSADEDLARRLQAEDLLNAQRSNEADSFSMIADEQLARSLAAEDVATSSPKKPDFSSKLKRQKLKEMFPGVDRSFLDEVYKTYGYNMDLTVDFLTEHLSQGPAANSGTFPLNGLSPPSPPVSPAKRTIRESTPDNTHAATRASGATASSEGDDDQWFDIEDFAAKATYEDYRAEALIHQKQRQECLQKAAVANQKRMYAVSVHYSRMAEQHWQNHQKANFEAATAIFKMKNRERDPDEIDLHGLHANEAVELVGEIIKRKRKEGKRFFHIITGRGNQSKGGYAKVKNAVENYLNKNRVTYQLENAGMLRVSL